MQRTFPVLVLLSLAAAGAGAQSTCSSDGVPRPTGVLERFIDADCAECWTETGRLPGAKDLALDWIVPSARGEDAALSAAASSDSTPRLRTLRRPAPAKSSALHSRIAPSLVKVRISQGPAVADYIGTSIQLKPLPAGRWDAWLLLVEELPAGTEGSPVARNLVRGVFRLPARSGPAPGIEETRAMRIPDGADPDRLRLVALVHDASGRLAAAVRTRCD